MVTTPADSHSSAPALTYAAAGVDTEAGDRAVELMKSAVARTHNHTVFGATGGFAGMVDASALKDMKRPLLATSTDGVGTKVALAQRLDIHDTIGQDLVGMVVDDIVVVGARPLLMTDYIACGHVNPQRIADIVRGVATACAAIDTPLLGGETAEHPGLMAADEYDVAGAATGVVDADRVLTPERVQAGDVLIGMAASGLHSNGYSLVRSILDHTGWGLERHVDEFGRTLGEELLEPTRLYTNECLRILDTVGVEGLHSLSHITGGGLGANISRVLPVGLAAVVRRDTWIVPPVFQVLGRDGVRMEWEELESTWNLGVGMVAVVSATAADRVLEIAGETMGAWVLGEVMSEDDPRLPAGRRVCGTKGVHGGAAVLTGEYRTR